MATDFKIREATPDDAHAIGELHAMSWTIAYRGLLSDEYLDDDLDGERKKYWAEKMLILSPAEFVLVAESPQGIVGFVSIMDKPEAGYAALLDNLHVRPDIKRKGLGGELMKAAARKLLATGLDSYYLWVLTGNTAAEKFYLAKHGVPEDVTTTAMGGKTVTATRYGWKSFDRLLNQSRYGLTE